MAHAHHHEHDGPDITPASVRRALYLVVAVFVAAAGVGLVLLWPEADRPQVDESLGLGAELVDATVMEVEEVPCANTVEADGILCQRVHFEVTSGSPSGETSTFEVSVNEVSVQLDRGDGIVLGYQPANDEGFRYYFNDFQRRTPMLLLAILFAGAVLALARWQGLRALIGLGVTGVVVVGFLFPSMLDGNSPAAVALVAAVVIALAALYLTHGINERSSVALVGTLLSLGLTAALASVFAAAARFTGFATEDAFFLQLSSTEIDIAGLVLAGIIIGSLGVLDDVTVTQVSAVWQIHQADPGFDPRRLFHAGLEVGRDHIASTVNTLVLAYAGASLPLLLLFTQAGRRLADVAVGELVAVEIVRTLVGSIGLVAAVPITTALAAWVVTRSEPRDGASSLPRAASAGGR